MNPQHLTLEERQLDLKSWEWLTAFASHLQARGCSANTVQAYVRDICSFAVWFFATNREDFKPELMTSMDLRAYRAFAMANWKPATWNRRRITLRTFAHWSQAQGYLTYDPFQGVDAWEEEELPPRWLEKNEFSRFMRQVELLTQGARTRHWRWQALRDQAMVALMAHAGLREGEVVALNVSDISIMDRSGRAIIWKGKGDKKREVPLNLEARRALNLWLSVRGEGEALFVGKGGERLSTRTVQRRISEIGRLAGISVTPHDLRHTFAKRLVDRGQPLTVVAKLLGHSRLDTTSRYVRPGWDDLADAVENQ